MKKIVFATNNPNKLDEVRALIPHWNIIGLKDIGCHESIPETESSLEGNAKLKADYVTKNYGYDCFADDTGLEIDALDGAPGVLSARYAGDDNDSEANMKKVLTNLENTSARQAQFRTVIALNINKTTMLFEGVCKGEILKEKTGSSGFGYDPIFQPKGFSTSFAEMSRDEKGKISHRGKAVLQLVNFLNNSEH
jgi:XTP/dITP diphosphohydrolase